MPKREGKAGGAGGTETVGRHIAKRESMSEGERQMERQSIEKARDWQSQRGRSKIEKRNVRVRLWGNL